MRPYFRAAVLLLFALFQMALPRLARAQGSGADRTEINAAFDAGTAAYDAGDYAKAAADFEKVLSLDPLHHRARLELARTYYAQGRLDESRAQFETVLSYNPPEAVQKNIRLFLDRIDHENRRFNIALQVSAGVLYDDNVNIGPASDLIHIRPTSFEGVGFDTLTVTSGSQPQSSWGEFAEGSLYAQYDAGAKGDWVWTGGVDYYQTWLEKHTDRELLYGDVFAGPAWGDQKRFLSLPARYAHIDEGGDTLVDIYGVAPTYSVALRDDLINSVALTAEYRDYNNFNDRDSVYSEIREQVTRLFDNKNKSVTGAVGAFYENAESDVNSNYGVLASLGTSISLPWASRLDVKGGYRGSWYVDREPLAPEDRVDNEFQGLVQFSKQIDRRWGIGLMYEYTKRYSTFDLYEYERNFVNLHLTYAM